MQERQTTIDDALFQYDDERDRRKNCYSFVRWALGIDPEEMIDSLGRREAEKIFQVVGTVEQADAIGVRDLSENGEYEHLALVDPSNPSFVIHRFNSGQPVTRISYEEFMHQRDGLRAKYEYDFLKLRDKRPWWLNKLRK